MDTHLRIGRVLGLGLSAYFRNFFRVSLMAAIACAPLLVYVVYGLANAGTEREVVHVFALGFYGSYLFGILATAMVSHAVFRHLRGDRVSVRAALAVALRRFFPILAAGVLVYVLLIVGTFLLIVPGVALSIMLWVTIPAAVVERRGVSASLRRSIDLTDGQAWRILVIQVAAIALGWLFWTAVQFTLGFAVHFVGGAGGAPAYVGAVLTMAALVVSQSGITASVAAVGYYELRQSKEGMAIDDLADVFA